MTERRPPRKRTRAQCRESNLDQELLILADEFSEYEAINAFACKSFTSILSTSEPQAYELIQGAKYMAEFLGSRAKQLKFRLESIRECCGREAAVPKKPRR